MLALILKHLKGYALPLLLVAVALLCARGVQLRIERAEHRAEVAEATAAISKAAYQSAVLALQQLEHETANRQTAAEVVVQEVERVRVETVEKIVYLEAQKEPQSCPEAIEFLTNFGRTFE